MQRLLRTVVALAAAVPAALAALPAAAQEDHRIVPGQSASGVIGVAGEEDAIHFFAPVGAKLTITVKQRKGGTLLPQFTKLLAPSLADLLPAATVKTNKKGTTTAIKSLVLPETGDYVLGVTGGQLSTGTYDLTSKEAPANVLVEVIDHTGSTDEVCFDVHAGSVLTLVAAAVAGEAIHPFVERVSSPSDSDVDLSGTTRKTTATKDSIKNLVIDEGGLWCGFVTGVDGSTGIYTFTIKPAKTPALDFDLDPPPPPGSPDVTSVNPTSFLIPSTANSMTVSGAGFQNGCTVAIAPSANVANLAVQFDNAGQLTVTFDVTAGAATGARSVTVTNPDLLSDTLPAAFTLSDAPTGISVTSVTPNSGGGDGGTAVLIQGTLFVPLPSAVKFGGIDAYAVNRVDTGNILCRVPPAASLSTGAGTAVDVFVENTPGDSATLAGGFTYDADPVRPTVVSTVPAVGATGVATNLQRVVLILSERAAGAGVTVGNFDYFRSAASGANDITTPRILSASPGADARMLVIQRGAASGGTMSTNSIYVAQIHQSGQTSGFVTDTAGNALDPVPFAGVVYQSSFTTGTGTDLTAPTVMATTPGNGAMNVDADTTIAVTFSEPVDPTSVAGAFSLKQGVTPVPGNLALDNLCTTLVFTPRSKLLSNTTYTIGVATTLRDLAVTALAAPFSRNFTTAPSDGTAPTAVLTVDGLPQDLNGSGTFIPGTSNGGAASAPGAATAFDAYVPRSGFRIDLAFADAGGSGVNPSSFTITCNRAVGSVNAGVNFANLFAVTPLGATWTVDGAHLLAAGDNAVFTANVSDYGLNAATTQTLQVDVGDITQTISNGAGTASTDRDPFNARQSWLLRFDQDIYAIVPSGTTTITVTSTGGANGTADLREDLALVGLNGTESGSAATVTNGSDTGTSAIVQRMFREAVRGHVNERYGITFGGTHGTDSVNIEFLLAGEQGSLGSVPNPATWTSGSGYSMMTVTGDESPRSTTTGTLGRATLDFRNTSQQNDSNTAAPGGTNLGVFLTNMIRVRINDGAGTSFRDTFDPLIGARGGSPVGSNTLDGTVLDDAFVYGSATPAQKARFDLITTAIDRLALYASSVTAHEIGHSTGLVPDGAPKAGLFGNAHPNNSFIEDPGSFTTQNHIDTPGPNVMEAAVGFDDSIAGGSAFIRFEPLSLAYLLRRMIYDQ